MNIFDLVKEESLCVIMTNSDVEIREYEERIELALRGTELFTVYDNKRISIYKEYKYRFTSFYYFTKQNHEGINTNWEFDTDDEEDIVTRIRELLVEAGV